ncbi:hypothetical protein ACQ4LE_003203 [Meloidogyne hapla]|uniref:Inhibitor_I29 domain-containing protein n=1 Tax=Meloidogyne hapla TaxID=6305 RepID=A0A1I8B1E8_MELHA
MRPTPPLFYMRFFKRRESLGQDPTKTQFQLMWSSGKSALKFIGFIIPVGILCLPSMDVQFDLLFFRHDKFRAYVEQYTRQSGSSKWTFNNQIRHFKTVRDYTTQGFVAKENVLKYKGID